MVTAALEQLLEKTKDIDLIVLAKPCEPKSASLESLARRHFVETSSGIAYGNLVGAVTETLLLGLPDQASINLKYMGSITALATSALYRYGRDKLINSLGITDKKKKVVFDGVYNAIYGFGMNWIWMSASHVKDEDMLWKTTLSTSIGLVTGAIFGKVIDSVRNYCYYPNSEGKLPEIKPENITKRRANVVSVVIPSTVLTAAYFYTRSTLGYTNTNVFTWGKNLAQNLGLF